MAASNTSSLSCSLPLTASESQLVDSVSFWAEGVTQTGLGALGIVGNVISCVILTRREMRNAFNLLLVTLATFDSCYLFGAILESVRKSFDAAPTAQILLFPRFLYPMHQTSMTGSIFMTVAIAFERYTAVFSPINYSLVSKERNP